MTFVSADGFAVPFDPNGQGYSPFGAQTAGLRSFYLAYDIGDSSPSDHEINLLQVLAGGNSQDLTPTADLSPSNIPDGRLSVAMQDAHPGGEEFFYRVSHSLLSLPGARRYQMRDVGCVGHCMRSIPLPGLSPVVFPPIIALVGFKLFFTGARDHNLDRVGVWFRGSNLHVDFADKKSDDTFGYLVDFVVIPSNLFSVSISRGMRTGTTSGGEVFNAPGPAGTDFFLTGWAFDFSSGDHEIRDLGVLRSGDDVTVVYADKNSDDSFGWRVEWAHIGPRRPLRVRTTLALP